MFGFDYTEGGAWSDDGIKSMGRFIDRVERTLESCRDYINTPVNDKTTLDKTEKELNYIRHFTIKSITEDADKMQFNTCIARLMEYTNGLSKYINEKTKNASFLNECLVDFIKLISPFAPHFAEEQWELLGMPFSIFNTKWPEFNPDALIKDEIEIAIQINGKVKGRINIPSDFSETAIKEAALNSEDIKKHTEGKNIVKVIVIKGRLVNIVVK